jgi:flagellar biosynthetic protein FliR
MTLLFADVVQLLGQFIWPLVRVSAFLLAGPFFSLAAVNLRVRLALVLVLTWLIYPLVEIPDIDPFSFNALTGIFHEVMVGGIMGLTLQIVVAALVVAGQAIAGSMGLSMANMIDPNLGNVPSLSQFFLIIGTLLFLSLGGHLIMISVLYSSFDLIPIFSGAVVIAFPILIGLLLVNSLLGLVSRAAPSLNVFAIGFPALIPLGLGMLLLTMTIWFEQVENLWFIGFDQLNEVIRGG